MKVSLKTLNVVLILIIIITFGFTAILPRTVSGQVVEKGPPLDVIYFDVRTSQDVGVGDTASGITDVFLWPASEAVWKRTDPEIIANLKLIRTASGYWSLLFNPVEDNPAVPGIVTTTSGEVHFNPFAIKDVRYAMNWLINRKYIIEEILAGGGAPMYSPIQPSEPANKKVEHVYPELGLEDEGNFAWANQTINNALSAAATTLATYGYTLEQKPDTVAPAGFWWTFTGNWTGATEETVTVNFLIRIEDERHEEGLYIADQLEKAGIKVERLERDRLTCVYKSYYTNPKDDSSYVPGLWHIYTEGWVSMAEWLWPEWAMAQMYAPWVTFMPGWGDPAWWQYTNSTIDETSQKIVFGPVASVDEYWSETAKIIRMGIQESVRIFVAETWEYFPVNPRVSLTAYGAVSGLWPMWPLRTAVTPDKTLKATEFSAAGALFMSAWNPIGGFTDVYSELIWRYIRDYADYPHPMTADPIPVRTNFTVQTGDIDVPTTAIVYDGISDAWVTVGAGKKAKAKVIFDYSMSNWHHGQPMTLSDILYSWGFMWEWSTNDTAGDPYYDSRYASSVAPVLEQIAGIEILNETAITVYGNYTHPVSDAVTADYYAVWPTLPWEVMTSMEELVADNAKYGIVKDYDWYQVEGAEWIDMVVADHVTDVQKVMDNLRTTPYLPPYINYTGDTTTDDAIARYRAAYDWASDYNHIVISNGPYYLKEYISAPTPYMELRAFRDPTYPFGPTYWQEKLFLVIMEIQKIEAPTEVVLGEDIPIKVYPLLKEEYPEPKEEPATTGYIEMTFKDPNGTAVYSGLASYVSPGLFSFTVPSAVTSNLTTGIYSIEVLAAVEKGLFADVSSIPVSISKLKFPLTIGVCPFGKGETSPGVGTVTYEIGTNVTVAVTPAEGYEFDYWELDGVPYSNEATVTITIDKPHTLVANLRKTAPTSLVSPEILSIISLMMAVSAVIAVAIVVIIILPRRTKLL
jgi:peptide/nickel transport system substrate-binding protein